MLCFGSNMEYWLMYRILALASGCPGSCSGSTACNSSVPQFPLYKAGVLVVMVVPNS